MTDLHTHILPGLDDGPQSPEESAAIVTLLATLGFDQIFMTPHFRVGLFDNPPIRVQKALEAFRAFLNDRCPSVSLTASHEVHLDSVLDAHGNVRVFLTFGAARRYTLLEMPRQMFPFDMLLHTIDRLFLQGIHVVLAHPERHLEMSEKPSRCRMLFDKGVKFQVNITSLVGLSGPRAEKAAEAFCREGFVHAFGTDTHSLAECRVFVPKGLKRAARLLGEKHLHSIMTASEFRTPHPKE